MKLGQRDDAIRDFTRPSSCAAQRGAAFGPRPCLPGPAGRTPRSVTSRAPSTPTPASPSAYRNRAEASSRSSQYDEAIEDLSRAIAFDATNAELYVVRGYAYLATGNTPRRIKDFSRAIEIDAQLGAGL